MSKTIVVTSGKGGVGKSTVSVNIAYKLSDLGYRVCLIDADFGLKNLDVMLGLENRVVFDLKDVIHNRCHLKQVLVKDKRKDSLYLLPACKSMSFDELNTDYMIKMMEILKDDFDYILIDSPAGVEKGFQYATGLSKEAIIVVTLDIASLRDADRVIGLLTKQGIYDIKMIVNKYNENDIVKRRCLSLKDAYDILSIPLLGIVFDDHDVLEANNRGKPIAYDNNHQVSLCFKRIVDRIEGKTVAFVKSKKKTIFEKIFKS